MAKKELFEDVFNAEALYGMLFINVKGVLAYPTIKELEENNKPLFDSWKFLSKTKYGFDMDVKHSVAGTMTDETSKYAQKTYEENAVNHPEYTKIVAITCATIYLEKGELKRFFQKFADNNEHMVINMFMDVLRQISSEGTKSSPPFFPTLCGHNISSYDIPLLIKRFLINREHFERNDKQLPLILKRALNIKPWESGLIDITNVWKFNGYDISPMALIGDFLNLKKTTNLVPNDELSKYYWNNINEKPSETIEYVALQSATQTNMVIQLMNTLRQL